MTPDPLDSRRAHEELIRRRQRSRAIVTALLLGALVVLTFAIGMARMMQP